MSHLGSNPNTPPSMSPHPQLLVNIVNNLLSPKNEAGWNATRPSGAEGDSLMQVMRDFADVISRSLDYHIKDGLVTYKNAQLKVIREYVGRWMSSHVGRSTHTFTFCSLL